MGKTRDETFDLVSQGLKEAQEFFDGKRKVRITEVVVSDLPELAAKEIKAIRNNAGLSQSILAAAIGVSPKTVEAWEANSATPAGPARRWLSVLQQDPDVFESMGFVQYSSEKKNRRELVRD